MHEHAMDSARSWENLIIILIAVGCVPALLCENADIYLSRNDVLLLKDEENPKCFTRTEYEFTCFFETTDNNTYDFFYNIDEEKRCNVTVQKSDEGSYLHICVFPPWDIFLYVLTQLTVVETRNKTILYQRNVSIEDQVLLDAPVNVSLHLTGQVGELQLAWHADKENTGVYYGIRYSSTGLEEKAKEGNKYMVNRLVSLVPGECVQLRMRVKQGIGKNAGHWSQWSKPAFAMVPQRADDISLMCYSADLKNVICQWNEGTYEKSTYILFYKMGLSEDTRWRKCLAEDNVTDICRFHGDESQAVRVRLRQGPTPGPLSRTFYTAPFTLRSSIKTAPPGHLRGAWKRGRLWLSWDVPLPAPSAHLQYQVNYQLRGDGAWMTVFVKGPETETCLVLPAGIYYAVRVRAKPNGTIYSGPWSDWSHQLTGDIPTDIGVVLITCIPLIMLIMAIVFISIFSRYLRKLKQYLWPPIPNLNKVLHGFLTEMNKKTWDPSFTSKQHPEETPASVLEVMSEEDVSGLRKSPVESSQLLSSERRCSFSEEPLAGNPGNQPEINPDYVTLNTDNAPPGQKGNEYVYKQVRESGALAVGCGIHQTASHRYCSDFSSHSSTDILNQSYLPLGERADGLIVLNSTTKNVV